MPRGNQGAPRAPAAEPAARPSRRRDPRSAPDAPIGLPRRDYSRRRAACLIAVYVLMAAHVAHWKLAGTTLAPLELNEVLYTLELGIVTAGFIFMALAVLATAVFGRFFCSWGCHILALQDLCAWLLGRIGIRPKPVRSRVLLLVPMGAMLYMFAWPHLQRVVRGGPAPELKVLGDADGWASFVTSDFWRNLPGPGIAALTFAVCGFAMVYVLGSRSFCRYACPYGAIFGLADRAAPGRIKAIGDCSQCGVCTATCQSHVRVHQEITAFGRVVSPACLKDLDCVAACPNGALAYGFTRPSLFASLRAGHVPYDFTLCEDALMAVVFIAALVIFRGLYGAVPFLLALAMGGILAYVAVLSLRLVRVSNVRLNPFQFRRNGRLTRAGRAFAVTAVFLAAFTIQSGFVRYHEHAGGWGLQKILESQSRGEPVDAALADRALGHLEQCRRWGLVEPLELSRQTATLLVLRQRHGAAVPHIARLLDARPDWAHWRLTYAAVLLTLARAEEAERQLGIVLAMTPAGGAAEPRPDDVRAQAAAMLAEIRSAREWNGPVPASESAAGGGR